MTKQILGKVAYVSRGIYNSSSTYEINDVVTYGGSSYVALKDTQGNLPIDENFWQLIAKKGDTYEMTEQDIKDLENKITNNANSEFNRNYGEKLELFNNNATSSLSSYNSNADNKTTTFDNNAKDKTDTFNSNATSKTNTFNTTATSKTNAFNTNANTKQTSYDTNATSKLKTYNDNHDEKLEEYNNNHNTKLADYNQNANDKINDFDENVKNQIDHYNDSVIDFETVLDVVTPKQNAKGSEIVIDDALPLPIFESKVEGRSHQDTTTGKNKIGFADMVEKTVQGVKASILDNLIILSGQNTQTYAVNISRSLDVNLSVTEDTSCTLSYKVLNGQKNVKLGISFRDENDAQLDFMQDINATDLSTTKVISIDTINKTRYFNFFVRTQEVLSELKIIVQLEFNSEATEVENYTGGIASPNKNYSQDIENVTDVTLEIGQDSQIESYPIPLDNNFIGGLGDTTDVLFIDKKGNVSLNKYIFKKIFDGSENWFKSGLSTGSVFVIALDITNLNINFDYRMYFLSNHFKYNVNSVQKNTFRIYEGDSNKYYIAFCFDINDIPTLSDAITWLTNNQLELEFVSNNMETIQLKKLAEPIKTFEGINNIKILSNLDAEVEVKYPLDIKKYMDKQNSLQDTQINEINTLLSSTDTSAMLLNNYQSDLESEV